MENVTKRFEEWEAVDCNECTHYWDSSCDAVQQNSRRQCNSFLATRRVVIPAKLKELETRTDKLESTVVAFSILFILNLVLTLMRWI